MLTARQDSVKSDAHQVGEISSLDFIFHVGLLHVLTVTFAVLCCRFYLCGRKWSYLDVVLAVVCSAMGDQIVQWGSLFGCGGGISMWLLGLYFFVCVSSLLCCIQSHILGINSFLMLYISKESNKGQNKVLMQALAKSWITMLAFLSLLTVSGIMCFIEVLDSECGAHTDSHASLAFLASCIALCGLLVPVGAICMCYAQVVSSSLNRGGAALNAITDQDFVERWGEPNPILEEELKCGLTPDEIACLSCMDASGSTAEGSDCVICLSSILADDRIRLLPNCGHAFHRPCVDQWLLRAGNCPLCKAKPTLPSEGV